MALSDQQQQELYDAICGQRASESPLAAPGEGKVGNLRDLVGWIDGCVHWQTLKAAAELGHPESLNRLRQIAGMSVNRYPDRADDSKLAQAILADIAAKKNRPQPQSAAEPQVVEKIVYRDAPTPEPRIVYVDRPAAPLARTEDHTPAHAAPEANGVEVSIGQKIGRFIDVLDELKLADALSIDERATLSAAIAVLETKNGADLRGKK